MKQLRKMQANLKRRQAAFDAAKGNKKGFKRPGRMNKKGGR